LIYAELINIYMYAVPLLIIALIVQVGYTMKLMSIMFGETVGFVQSQRLLWSDLGLHEIAIALLLIVPTWYLGVNGENVIRLLTQTDPLLHHHHYTAEIGRMLVGDQQMIDASRMINGNYIDKL
jgi:hypothetical protein